MNKERLYFAKTVKKETDRIARGGCDEARVGSEGSGGDRGGRGFGELGAFEEVRRRIVENGSDCHVEVVLVGVVVCPEAEAVMEHDGRFDSHALGVAARRPREDENSLTLRERFAIEP